MCGQAAAGAELQHQPHAAIGEVHTRAQHSDEVGVWGNLRQDRKLAPQGRDVGGGQERDLQRDCHAAPRRGVDFAERAARQLCHVEEIPSGNDGQLAAVGRGG